MIAINTEIQKIFAAKRAAPGRAANTIRFNEGLAISITIPRMSKLCSKSKKFFINTRRTGTKREIWICFNNLSEDWKA